MADPSPAEMANSTPADARMAVTREEYQAYLTKKVADEVERRMELRIQGRNRILGLIFAVAGMIGIGTAWNLLEGAINRRVDQKTQALTDELSNEIRIQQIASMTLRSSNGRRDPMLREEIMSGLRDIEQSGILARRDDLYLDFESVIDWFYNISANAEIEQIDGMFRDRLITRYATINTMINYYGERVIGSSLPESDPSLAAQAASLAVYMDAARKHNARENELFWSMLREFKRSEATRTNTTDGIVEHIVLLPSEDRHFYNVLADRYRRKLGLSQGHQEYAEISRISDLLVGLERIYPGLETKY